MSSTTSNKESGIPTPPPPIKKDLFFAGVGVFSVAESKTEAIIPSVSDLDMTINADSALRYKVKPIN